MREKFRLYFFYLLMLFLLGAFLSLGSQDVSAVTCSVPTDYPDVYTALNSGCNNIFFTSDVTENNPIDLDVSFTPYDRIYIDGYGFRWIFNPMAQPRIKMKGFTWVNLTNIDMTFDGIGSPAFAIFNQTEVNITNTYIHFLGWFYGIWVFNSSLHLFNSALYKDTPYSTPLVANSYGQEIAISNISIYGDISTLSAILEIASKTNASFSNSYVEGEISISINEATGYSTIGTNISLSNMVIVGGGLYNLLILSHAPGVNIYVERVSILLNPGAYYGLYLDMGLSDPVSTLSVDYLYVDGSNLINTVGLGIGWYHADIGSFNVLLNDFRFEDVNIGLYADIPYFYIPPYHPLEGSIYIYMRNGVMISNYHSMLVHTPVGVAVYLDARNIFFRSRGGDTVILSSYHKLVVDFRDIITESVTPDIILNYYGVYRYLTRPPLNDTVLRITHWISNGTAFLYNPGYTSLRISTLDNQRAYVYISYSLFKRFTAFGNASIKLNETVYDEINSLTSGYIDVRSMWTLDVRLVSTYTNYPIRNMRVDTYRYSLYRSGVTDSCGDAYIPMNYTLDTSNPFIRDLYIGVDTLYFSGRWGYHYDLGYNITLPSWYSYILLRIPLLSARGYGHMNHIPIVIEFYGDYGAIYQFKSTYDVVKIYLGGNAEPVKTIRFKIVNVLDRGIYLIANIRILNSGLGIPVPETIYIYPRNRIIYAPGGYLLLARY